MAKKSGRAVSKGKSKTLASKKAATKPKAKTSKKATSKSVKVQPQTIRTGVPRRLKPPKRKFWQLPKPVKHPVKLPNVWRLTKTAAETLWLHKRLFIGITLVYGVLNLILVKGLASSTDVGGLKSQLSQAFHGHFGSLASGLSIFVVLVGSAGNGSSQTAGAYQLFLALVTSLAIIWALRQVLAGVA
ncbi:MAG TPA: hypothetical protein VK712_03820, partial [Verrucomicrobiae bacterium]|nr:hypothetical protein [Verrucomicrobiae bacterium]